MAHLGENRYGKSRIRLSRITRHGDRHDFSEWTVSVLLRGDFETSFTQADNSSLLPTDTMKNTVYSIARSSKFETMEEFAMELGDHFLSNNAHVSAVSIEITSKAWERLVLNNTEEPTTFKLGGPELQTTHAARRQDEPWQITSGIQDLTILKTTKSAFTGYIVDKLTTLQPATDRIFGTAATATWDYTSNTAPFAQVRSRIVAALLKTFAAHDSQSVQHTLFDMGQAALAAAPEITRITLTMPNLHHLLANLTPFGQDNPNHIFVPIDEPHGYIEATIER
ncbi:factor-independent urate hydroxylase [Terracidiphilus gabretensis]|uniref:factor-independent urate hydroxylase n=1 Tax=Terracidiphilus gabretensis TaxID=1577687 RepID=UPI00071B5B2D|nr:urate oxidase [Terracidiphilus gabretensis]